MAEPDVHRDVVAVCTRTPGPHRGIVSAEERLGTTASALVSLGDQLKQPAVGLVAMEATGVYWKPVRYALDEQFEVWLCNAHHVKNVPGRKTDMSDAEWLADVVAPGMARPTFVPPRPIRELTRNRSSQVDAWATEVRRLETVLQDAGVKLTSVASKVLTQSTNPHRRRRAGHQRHRAWPPTGSCRWAIPRCATATRRVRNALTVTRAICSPTTTPSWSWAWP
jgi:transposase